MTAVTVAQAEVASQQGSMQAAESAAWAFIGLNMAVAVGAAPPLAVNHSLWWLPLPGLTASVSALLLRFATSASLMLGPSVQDFYSFAGEEARATHLQLLADLIYASGYNRQVVTRQSHGVALGGALFLAGLAGVGPALFP